MDSLWLGVLGWILFEQATVEHMKKKYERFDEWRRSLKYKEYLSFEIKEKMIFFEDNILDFENLILGIAIKKREKYIEKANKVLDQEFEMCLKVTNMIRRLTDNLDVYDDTHSYLLDIGIVYSQILQSYADTLDELTND